MSQQYMPIVQLLNYVSGVLNAYLRVLFWTLVLFVALLIFVLGNYLNPTLNIDIPLNLGSLVMIIIAIALLKDVLVSAFFLLKFTQMTEEMLQLVVFILIWIWIDFT